MNSAQSIHEFSSDFYYSSPPPEGAPKSTTTTLIPSPTLRESRLPFCSDTAINRLTVPCGFSPRTEQVTALEYLYNGKDHILVAPCGWGKTIIITALACIIERPLDSITLIISPLRSIQSNKALALRREIGQNFRPFVLDGDVNTAETRHLIASDAYTQIG